MMLAVSIAKSEQQASCPVNWPHAVVGCRAGSSSFKVGWQKCTVGLRSNLLSTQSVKKFSLSISKLKGLGITLVGVFGNQYCKCSHACRSVLEVLSVSCACRRRPMVVDLVSSLHPEMCPENHTFFLPAGRVQSAWLAGPKITLTMYFSRLYLCIFVCPHLSCAQ